MKMDIENIEAQIERVDDLPLLYGMIKRMEIQSMIDQVIIAHGNWQGISPGWVISIWLIHILSEQNHLMEPVQKWVSNHLTTLQRLSGQALKALDFTDDRLALCLHYLHSHQVWSALESRLGQHLIRIYELSVETIRLDATVGSVYHDPENHALFQVGKAKNGVYGPLFKLMVASLDPLGMPLVVDVVAGQQADDPLYVPAYLRAKAIVGGVGKLVVGDSKMSALATRATIVHGQDAYLTPLAHEKAEPALLDQLLAPWVGRMAEASLIFLPEDLAADGRPPDPKLAIAAGFEVTRPRSATVNGQLVHWDERLLVVRSESYSKTMQNGLNNRLAKAEAALRALTPAPQRGKRPLKDEATLLAALAQIQQQQRVNGLFTLRYTQEISEKQVRGYKGNPSRLARKVRFHLTVTRNQAAIAAAHFRAGWRIYATNALTGQLSLQQAVLAYRDQYLEEHVFARLHGKFLSITPLYIQREDHASGLFHLLTLAVRLLALGDYLARQALAQERSELAGIYDGNPKRSTATPTTERLLKAFAQINLLLVVAAPGLIRAFLTPLTSVQVRILALLGLSTSLYTDLQMA
jgi:transposase